MSRSDGAGPDAIAERVAACGAVIASEPVKWIQTHISHVFVGPERVYKLRKSVKQPFLDFSTRDRRNTDCERELHLNRRLAPDVYLGIAPLGLAESGVELGPLSDFAKDAAAEHVVVMRRLPEGRDALAMLDREVLRPDQLERAARRIAGFHEAQNLGRPAPWTDAEWFARTSEPAIACVDELRAAGGLDAGRLAMLDALLRATLERLRPAFEARRAGGFAVDGHGDLHLDHVWFEGDESDALMIDCLEFDEDLRRIDTASEVAFLAMDLEYRGRPDLASAFLSAYAQETDDYGLFGVVDVFTAYRSLVRAKVAGLAASQAGIAADQRRAARASLAAHVELAERFLAPRSTGGLILLCGTVGSGKSTVARNLARSGRGIQIASDHVRKRRAGLAPNERASDAPDRGLYTPEQRDDVYREMLDRAEAVTRSGRTAILDASFAQRAHRDLAREWADARDVPAQLIEVRCDDAIVRKRLVAREAAGDDASDAGPGFLKTSLERFEPPDEWPEDAREVVSTDRDGR